MSLSLNSSLDVFVFIIFCSIYVCSTLWIYGDAVTRNAAIKGLVLVIVFISVGTFVLMTGHKLVLLVWPIIYAIWFCTRPVHESIITSD